MSNSTIAIVFTALGVIEIIYAIYVLIANPRARENRGLAGLFTVFSANSLIYAQVAGSNLYSEALPWYLLFAGVTYMIGPVIYLSSVMILRPAWLRHRWLYVPVGILIALPLAAVLVDYSGALGGLLTQPLLFAPPAPDDFFIGTVDLSQVTGGWLRPLLSAAQFAMPSLAMVCPMLVVAIRDRTRNRPNSQIAAIFLAATAAASIAQIDPADAFATSVSTLLSNIFFFLGFSLITSRIPNIQFGGSNIRRSINDWSIFAKLVLIVLSIILPAITITTAVSSNVLRQNVIEQVGANLISILNARAEAIGSDFEGQINNMQRLGQSRAIETSLLVRNSQYDELTPAEIRAIIITFENAFTTAEPGDETVNQIILGNLTALSEIQGFRGVFGTYRTLTVVDRQGALLTATHIPNHYDYTSANWWKLAEGHKNGKIYISPPILDPASGDRYAQIVIPIYDSANPTVLIGMVMGEYSINPLMEEIAESHTESYGIDLYGPSGIFIELGGQHEGKEVEGELVNWNRLLNTSDPWLLLPYEDTDSIVAWTTIGAAMPGSTVEDLQWRLTVHENTDIALQGVTNSVRLTGLITVFVVLAAFALTWTLANFISQPIASLAAVAGRIREGDLSVKADADRRDEIGALAGAFNTMTAQLNSIVAGLETEVASRTADLERQAVQLQAATQVGQAASSILDVDDLIQTTVEVIRDRFDLYYVGLFLTDVDQDFAVLQAGTGSAGQIMLARGHRIRIGEGMIGWSIQHSQPRVAKQAGEDIVRLASPELPETRSEAAIPLRARGQVIGAISVQSARPEEFTPTTMNILQTMADQVAIAIDNANLLAENREALAESQRALETVRRTYQQVSREAWNSFARQTSLRAASTARGAAPPPETRAKPRRGGNPLELSVPLKIRDHPAGVLRLRKSRGERGWAADEVELIEQVTEQLGLALDSARLYQDTQLRSVQLHTSAEVASAASSILNLDELLPTAVNLIGDRFNLYYAGIFLVDEAREWAVLQAGTGEAGRIQAANQHRLELGGRSMIGQCIANGKARIAMDVGAEAVRFENPLLPDTRTEMAIPLTYAGETIGALTVQSSLPAAFTDDDVTVFQTLADQLANAIQNARLYQQSRAATSQAQTQQRVSDSLVKSANRFSVAGDEANVHEIIISEIMAQISPDQVNLLAWEAESQGFRVARRQVPGGHNLSEGELIPAASRKDLVAVFEKNEAQYLPEVRGDGLTHEQYRLPWLLANQPIGVIEIFHTARGAHIRPEDRAVIDGIIRQADVALQSARAFAATQDALRRTEALFRVSQAASGMDNLPHLLQAITENITTALPADRVLLLTLDMREKKVVHFIQTGVTPGTLPPIPYEELLVGLTGWVLRERRPAISPKNTIDPRESPEVQKRREAAAAGSIMVVPLIYRGRVLGTITATNEIENPDFTEADADLMLAMANQAAVAIQNALLLEETQKTAENERLLNQIASQLTQSLDFETVLQTALQEIAQLPHVSEVSLTLETPANGAGNKR